MTDDREAAWAAGHDATPPGWYVGRPSYHDERHEWTQYAFDPREVAKVGARSRAWTSIDATEVECLREIARCLRAQRGSGATLVCLSWTRSIGGFRRK